MKHINILLHEAHDHTTYNQSYTLKCNDRDLTEKVPNTRISSQRVHYIKSCDEQVRYIIKYSKCIFLNIIFNL